MVAHSAMAGHYTATFNTLDLGKTDEGWTYEVTHKGRVVRFEEYSDNMIDLIYRGAEVTVETVLKEWNSAGLLAALWPWSATYGKVDCSGLFAVAGDFAKPLVLTANSCSPAGSADPSTDGPATMTFHKAIMAPEVASRINLNNDTRMVPIRFNTFLWDTDSPNLDNRYFSFT